jgi:archaemetzincin
MKELRQSARCSIFLSLLFAVALVPANPIIVIEDPAPLVAIQPLGKVDTLVIKKIAQAIGDFFPVRVAVQPAAGLPSDAFYEPNRRYRADQLLVFLDSIANDHGSEFLKLIGITEADISTTKGEVYDWGIFGLGYLPGRVCVVSTFRLGRNKVTEDKFFERLVKVANHELGHNFGLDHCPNEHCLMEDAKGTIKTVDRETGRLCPDCQARLKETIR